jgi:rod shape-determining protein MreD
MRGLLAAAVIGGGVAGTTLAPALRIAEVTPDIGLIVVVLLALRRGPEVGCVGGFVVGLLQDAAGGGLLGIQALTKAVVGFAIGTAGGRLAVQHPVVQVVGIVLLTVAEGVGRFALLRLLGFPASLGEVLVYLVIPQALYNGFLGALLAFALAGAQLVGRRA